MSALEWFYAKDNRQEGPVTPQELKQLASSGQLKPADLVWREGMTEWIAAAKVKGLFEEEPPAAAPLATPPAGAAAAQPVRPPPANQPAAAGSAAAFPPSAAEYDTSRQAAPGNVADALLAGARAWLDEAFLESTCTIFALAGHAGLYLAAALLLAVHVTAALQQQNGLPVLVGVAEAMLLLVLQFMASRLFPMLERLRQDAPAAMPSRGFSDGLALLHAALGLIGLVGLSILAVRTQQFSWIAPAVAVFIVCQSAAVALMNPAAMNLSIDAGADIREESLALLELPAKLLLRIAPVLFGAGVAWGCVAMLHAGLLLLPLHASQEAEPHEEAVGVAAAAGVLLLASAAIPTAVYVLSLLWRLGVDMARAILSLGKTSHQNAEETGPS